jgi:peptide chain release factor 2
MFSGEMDPNNAYLDIQAGSGGTEAQDWANILLRMYLRWADKRGFDATIMELSEGEVAGIKGATVHIKGEYAFGWLRTEIGVHRLVRKSPFDSGNRRHTSFSAVFVSPEIDDKVEIEINPSDLRIDTYRSSGAGGQHEHHRLGGTYHPRTDQHRGGLPERTFPARQQGHRHENAAGQVVRAGNAEAQRRLAGAGRQQVGHRLGSPDPFLCAR